MLAIRQTNDCVSNPVISGTLTLCSTRGTVQISQDSASFGNFGDSAVALIHSRNYYRLVSIETVFSGASDTFYYTAAFLNML